MIVYVLFHADIEDDRYVRGVFSSEEAAEAQVDVHELHDYGRGSQSRRHGTYCCFVEEYELDPPMPQYGPFPTDLRDPNATPLLRYDLVELLAAELTRPSFPAFDRIRTLAPLDTVGKDEP